MKLFIQRDQADRTGFFGAHKGVNFILKYRAELTDDEATLIEKYKLYDTILHSWTVPVYNGTPYDVKITVGDMIHGGTLSIHDFAKIMNDEEQIISGAKTFKQLLELMPKFGGEEIIDLD